MATAVDDVAGAPVEPHESVAVDVSQVARVDETLGVFAIVDADRSAGRPHQQMTVGVDPDRDAGMGLADGAELVGVGLGVGRGPPDHLAGLGLAVAVEHEHPELRGEAFCLHR